MVNQLYTWLLVSAASTVTTLHKLYLYIFQSNHDSNINNITLTDRFISMFPYGLPFFEGLQNFAPQILPDYPFGMMNIYKKTFMPIVIFYMSNPSIAFGTFFLLYYFFVRSHSPIPHRAFISFNALQSILLFLIHSLLGAIFRAFPIEFRTSIYGLTLCNTLLWFVIFTTIYSIIYSIAGKYSHIPIVSQAAKIHIDTD
uniref:Tic20 family protein Ycf60 n=1 Tax=Dicranema revolutum TaxID=239144 RepID=A0A4D6WRB1_9FLOR|nr:hypothetical protein [Dicranema revolutum]